MPRRLNFTISLILAYNYLCGYNVEGSIRGQQAQKPTCTPNITHFNLWDTDKDEMVQEYWFRPQDLNQMLKKFEPKEICRGKHTIEAILACGGDVSSVLFFAYEVDDDWYFDDEKFFHDYEDDEAPYFLFGNINHYVVSPEWPRNGTQAIIVAHPYSSEDEKTRGEGFGVPVNVVNCPSDDDVYVEMQRAYDKLVALTNEFTQ